MGYYQGNGIVSGGSVATVSGGSVSLPMSGSIFLKRKTRTTVTKFPGVSLATAQSKDSANTMSARLANEWQTAPGGGFVYYNEVVIPDYAGDTTSFSYSQIGDSNLYELIQTIESVSSSYDRNIQRI